MTYPVPGRRVLAVEVIEVLSTPHPLSLPVGSLVALLQAVRIYLAETELAGSVPGDSADLLSHAAGHASLDRPTAP